MNNLIDLNDANVLPVLPLLLKDKTTKGNILWATDSYGHPAESEMLIDQISTGIIEPRVQKALEARADRTKTFAEVFTPSWICNRMNNYADESWLGRKAVFNVEQSDSWTPTEGKIAFSEDRPWTEYVHSRRIEVTCGEAPFLVSRYDASTGEMIPVKDRIGLLDRKLRVVNENTDNEADWMLWVTRAFQSVYGYEFQGDNLLIARINLLMTFIEYLQDRWNRQPGQEELRTIADIIAWNIWQMDGLTNTVPFSKPTEDQLYLFAEDEQEDNDCLVYDWRDRNDSVKYRNMGKKGSGKFALAIGNPPYQENAQNTSDNPIYYLIMEETYRVADAVEMITPGRFLFNAGKTPELWNTKMLNDEHLKVLFYHQKSSDIFANTDIKGGIAITYRDRNKTYDPVQVFVSHDELKSIMDKVTSRERFFLDTYVFAPESYRFTPILHKEHPELTGVLTKGHDNDLTTNIFDKLTDIVFHETKPEDGREYVRIIGRKDGVRKSMYIARPYIESHENLEKWKVIIPKANGTGAFGETLSTPVIAEPLLGHTQSFISVGALEDREEAEALLKYIKSKFCRTMLGILKRTQDNKKSVWALVPQQDFSIDSDIDWTASVKDIDSQLYEKYRLTKDEIEFIETHVKEMD